MPGATARLFLQIAARFLRQISGGERGDLLPLLRPSVRQLAHFFRLLVSEILGLAAIGAEIVKLPRTVFSGRDDFPVADAKRAIVLVEPPERIPRDSSTFAQKRHEAPAGRRRHWLAVPFCRRL